MACRPPGLGGHEFEDRRLHGVERSEHPGDRPRPRIGIVREQSRMVLGDVEDDRACLKQDKIAFLIGRNQPERMKAQMRGFRLRPQRDKANLVGLAHLFKRPANARIARQARAAIGRPLKGGDDDGHRATPLSRLATLVSAVSSRGQDHVHRDSAHVGNSSLAAEKADGPAERQRTATSAASDRAGATSRSSSASRPASPTSRTSSGSPMRAAAARAARSAAGVRRCASHTTRR